MNICWIFVRHIVRIDGYLEAHQLLFRRQRRVNCKHFKDVRFSYDFFYKWIWTFEGPIPFFTKLVSQIYLHFRMALFKYYFGGANKLLLTPHEGANKAFLKLTKVPSSLLYFTLGWFNVPSWIIFHWQDEEKNTHSEREP